MTDTHLLGLCGALREGSCNRKLLREAARLFAPGQYHEADLNLPLYDGDLETGSGIPATVQLLADQIARADAVLIATPEYNKGPSGVLKNALDWVSRTQGNPWHDKPVAVMSAAAGRAGGERAQLILRGFLNPFRPHLLPGPELHLAQCQNQFDTAGNLTSAQYTRTLQELMDTLRAQVSIKGAAPRS